VMERRVTGIVFCYKRGPIRHTPLLHRQDSPQAAMEIRMVTKNERGEREGGSERDNGVREKMDEISGDGKRRWGGW
jgi:hypothetical protein